MGEEEEEEEERWEGTQEMLLQALQAGELRLTGREEGQMGGHPAVQAPCVRKRQRRRGRKREGVK